MSKKHQLKGLEIIYEDREIIVVNKESGLLTIATPKEKFNTAHFILNEYVKKGNPRSKERVYIVHRLDKDTSGLLVFAKSEKSKLYLQRNWADFNKKYVTIVNGRLPEKTGIIESYLLENSACKVYTTQNNLKGKYAKTGYTVLKEVSKYSLLEIQLYTGRKNQIRVHLSDFGYPILGDRVYGNKGKDFKRLALHSFELTLIHPFSKKEISFKIPMPQCFNLIFKDINTKTS